MRIDWMLSKRSVKEAKITELTTVQNTRSTLLILQLINE